MRTKPLRDLFVVPASIVALILGCSTDRGRSGKTRGDASTGSDGSAGLRDGSAVTSLGSPFLPGDPQSCATLVPWPFHGTALVVKDGDGFASPVSTDAGMMLTVFDVGGTPARDIGMLRTAGACSGGPYGAWTGGRQTVGLSGYAYKFNCGTDLTIGGTTMGVISGQADPAGLARVAIAVRDDGLTVLAKSAVAQFSPPTTPRTISLSLLDRTGNEVSNAALPSEVMDVDGVAVSSTGYVALVLGAPVTSTYAIPTSVRVVLLNPAFEVLTSWNAPSGVDINALSFAGGGSLVVAGSVLGGEVGPYVTWLQHLSIPLLSPVSPAATGDAGDIEDISIAQDKVVLAGLSTDQSVIQIDTWMLDGTPTTGPRLSQSSASSYIRLQLQSDGSLLVQSGTAGYVCR